MSSERCAGKTRARMASLSSRSADTAADDVLRYHADVAFDRQRDARARESGA